MKRIATLLLGLAFAVTCSQASANLVIFGVTDGDLPGGNPKSIILCATADIADLSIYGVGSANNGGGTDGEEFTLSGSASTGDKIVIANGATGMSFFSDNYVGLNVQNTTGNFVASINGDDAIELFQSGSVIDTYGDINVDGNGETWEYLDGYAVRTGGSAGAFNQANYNSVAFGLDGLDEAQHISTIGSVFGFQAIPEPSSLAVLGLVALGLVTRRKRG